jgi:hypothetical protein
MFTKQSTYIYSVVSMTSTTEARIHLAAGFLLRNRAVNTYVLLVRVNVAY